jgi:hypothetical protein
MKITESELKEIIEEETEEVIQELAPALAALGGAAVRAGGAVGRAAMKGAGAIGKAAKGAAQNATKMMSKQTDVNKVLQGLNRIKAPTLMQKIDKPLELQDLLMNVLDNVKTDPRVIDAVLGRLRAQVKKSVKQQQAPQATETDPVGQPPAE